MIFLLGAALWPVRASFAGVDEVRLPAIVNRESAAEELSYDPVMPAFDGRTRTHSSTGAIEHSLTQALPFPIREVGQPGSFSSVRGLGRSVEDTNVQALGVPLNGPQGGGTDLSIFPDYLWDRFRFQLGPSVGGAFDPRASAGTLTLVPWTQAALESPVESMEPRWRLTQLYSGRGVTQLSTGVQRGNSFALVAGWTEGKAHGPSGSLSGRWSVGPRWSGRVHFLGTRLRAEVQGSRSYPTPQALQTTARGIPVVESTALLGGGATLKSTVFFDGTTLRYENPGDGSLFGSQVRQWGAENALLWEGWRVGTSFRRVSYRQGAAEAPADTLGHVLVSREIPWGESTWITPQVQGTGVRGFGFYPSGSLGARHEWEKGAVFGRAGYSRRFPSLLDRYAIDPTFLPNPDLRAERDWTFQLGGQLKQGIWETTLQGYVQLSEDTQITRFVSGPSGRTLLTPVNGDHAEIYALQHSTVVRPLNWLDLSHALTLSHSRVRSTQESFPYLPGLIDLMAVTAHDPQDRQFSLSALARLANTAFVSTGGARLSGYAIFDLTGRYKVWEGKKGFDFIDLNASLEDVLDRKPEFVQDYPTPGRTLVLGVTGYF